MFSPAYRTHVLGLAVLLILAACGGGGADRPNPVEEDPDILATDPEPFEENVAASRQIHIDFAVALDPASPISDFLSVATPNGALGGSWAYDAARQRATFTAADQLVIGAEHNVKVATGLRYDDGSTRARDFEFVFDVRPPLLGAPEFFESTNDLALGSLLAVHDNGNGMGIAQIELADGRTQVVGRRRNVSGVFEPQQTVATEATFDGGRMRVAQNGNVVLGWRLGAFGQGSSSQMFSYFDKQANAWRTRGFLENDNDLSGHLPHVAIDAAGNAFFAWRETVHSSDEVRIAVRRYTAAGTLEPTQHYSGFASDPSSLDLAANDRGEAIVTFTADSLAGLRTPYAARYTLAGAWTPAEPVASVPFECGTKEVVIGPNGYATVLLGCEEGVGNLSRRMRLAPYVPEGQPNAGWNPTIPLHADLVDESDYYMDVAADGEVVAVHAVETFANGDGQVRAARYVPSTGHLRTELLSAQRAVAIADTHHGISLSRGGDLIVYWTERELDVFFELRAAVWTRSGNVARDILIRRLTGTTRFGAFHTAAEPGGGGALIWTEPDPDLGGEPTRRRGTARVDADGRRSAIDFINPTPGDFANVGRIAIDGMGRGVILWRHEDSNSGAADIRFREIR